MNDETTTCSTARFNINDYTDTRYAMICESEYEAVTFTRYLDSVGRKWQSGASYLNVNYWGSYGDESIVYYFNRDVRSSRLSLAPDSIVLYFRGFRWDDWTEDIDISDTNELDDFLNQFEVK